MAKKKVWELKTLTCEPKYDSGSGRYVVDLQNPDFFTQIKAALEDEWEPYQSVLIGNSLMFFFKRKV